MAGGGRWHRSSGASGCPWGRPAPSPPQATPQSSLGLPWACIGRYCRWGYLCVWGAVIQTKKTQSLKRPSPSQPVSGSLVPASDKRGWSLRPSPSPPGPAPPPCRGGKWGHRWSFSSSGSSRLLHAGEGSPEDGGASPPFALRAATCALTCVLVPAAAAAPEPGAQRDSGHGRAPSHQQREEESWGKWAI